MPAIEGAQRPFWMHQLVEYLIGLVLIGAGFQSVEPAVPAFMGIVVIANAAIARGPASAFPLVGRRTHRWMDLGVVALLVVAGFQGVLDVDSTGRILMWAIAFVLVFVWLNSDFAEKIGRSERRAARARPESEEIGRKAGRIAGEGVNTAKRMAKKLKDDRPS